MARANVQYFRQVTAALRKGEVAPVYFMYGEEAYLVDSLIAQICQKFVGTVDKEINYFIRYAPDATLEDILALTAGAGLFSSRKVIVLKDYQNLRNPNGELLRKYLQRPDPEIVLIVVARVDSVSQAKYKILQEMALTVNLLPLREDALNEFIRNEFEQYQKTIASESVHALIYLVGEKINDLKTEIAQVANYYQDKTHITPDDIENVVGVHVSQNVFELTGAIAQKQLETSLFMLKNLLERGENPGSILFLLLRHITNLWKIRGFYQSGVRDEQKIREQLRIYPRQYQAYVKDLALWPLAQLNRAIELIDECDRALKSSQAKAEIVLDRLIVKLIDLN